MVTVAVPWLPPLRIGDPIVELIVGDLPPVQVVEVPGRIVGHRAIGVRRDHTDGAAAIDSGEVQVALVRSVGIVVVGEGRQMQHLIFAHAAGIADGQRGVVASVHGYGHFRLGDRARPIRHRVEQPLYAVFARSQVLKARAGVVGHGCPVEGDPRTGDGDDVE